MDVPGKHLLRSTPSEKPRLFSRKPGPFTTGMATMVPTRVTGSMSSTSLCTTGTPLSSSPCTHAVMRRTGPGCAPAAIKSSGHTPHHITSHHITSHHITSHHITSHHTTPHHITPHHITSHHMISENRPMSVWRSQDTKHCSPLTTITGTLSLQVNPSSIILSQMRCLVAGISFSMSSLSYIYQQQTVGHEWNDFEDNAVKE
jgi:hypothetical protein